MLRHLLVTSATLLVAVALTACEEAEPATGAQSCADIIDACHDVDDGTDPEIVECHETAHDVGTADACDPIRVRCVAACEAAEPVDGGHAHDAAAHDHDAGEAHEHDAAAHDPDAG